MKRKIKMVEQTEHSECGLACATMILNYEGINISLNEIRDTFGVPRGGISLYHLIQVMTAYGIKCKAYEILDIYSLRTISTPCIRNKHLYGYNLHILSGMLPDIFRPVQAGTQNTG